MRSCSSVIDSNDAIHGQKDDVESPKTAQCLRSRVSRRLDGNPQASGRASLPRIESLRVSFPNVTVTGDTALEYASEV